MPTKTIPGYILSTGSRHAKAGSMPTARGWHTFVSANISEFQLTFNTLWRPNSSDHAPTISAFISLRSVLQHLNDGSDFVASAAIPFRPFPLFITSLIEDRSGEDFGLDYGRDLKLVGAQVAHLKTCTLTDMQRVHGTDDGGTWRWTWTG